MFWPKWKAVVFYDKPKNYPELLSNITIMFA